MKGNIFIKRPVMAISISILILAIGLISLFTLPVEQCYHATGRKHQWCRKHDVHDFNSNQCRFGNDRGIFQTRDKPRYGSRQRTESCNEGTGFIAC